jgi:hypothetical protein
MKRGLWVLKFLVFGVAMLALFGLVTQALWNWLVPELFHGPLITFWQTLGLILLSKIFFWSFSKGGGHKWGSHRQGPWGYYWAEKWKGMSPEDRERLKQKMKDKWCTPDRFRSTEESDTSNSKI